MILADTSVWIDHLRARDAALIGLLQQDLVLMHPFVLGEIALGSLRERGTVLRFLSRLPTAALARDAEVAVMIERENLYGLGIGYVDAHLLASVRLTPDARLWTRDRRLALVAERQR